MTKTRFAAASCLVSIVAFASAFGFASAIDKAPRRAPAIRSSASWAYKTQDPARMARDVDAIVIATLDGVSAGRVAYSSNSEDSLAFEIDTFRVDEVLRGSGISTTVKVERVATNQGNRIARFDFDGGPFVPKTQYLLFLKKQSDADVFYQVNDEGRYAIDGLGRARSRAKGAVAAALHGRSVGQIRALVAAATRGR